MKFPGPEDKGLQYATSADILATTLSYMGYPPDAETQVVWRNMMYRLATADRLCEESPEIFVDGEGLVHYLGIDPNAAAQQAAEGLIRASVNSQQALSIDDHMESRRNEALQSVALLRSQSQDLEWPSDLWSRIEALNVAGIYLDSLFDAKEDAQHATIFSATELATASALRLLQAVREMDRISRKAITRAAISHGLLGHLVRNIPKKVFT